LHWQILTGLIFDLSLFNVVAILVVVLNNLLSLVHSFEVSSSPVTSIWHWGNLEIDTSKTNVQCTV